MSEAGSGPIGHGSARLLDRISSAVRRLCAVALVLALNAALVPAAQALKVISVGDQDRIELTEDGDFLDQRGDSIQIETAPGADGMAGRMGVRASAPGLSPNWLVFALRNTTDRPIERWVTAERYTVIGSGIVWPDLDSRRLEAVTPSVGFLPERIKSDRADIFKISLDPGQTITYAVELSTDRFARVYLWKPIDYELKARDRQLFNGILLGVTGVLGIFLTAVFAANHKPIFPSAALVTWCVLAYLCVDFGFWHKLFQLRPEDNAVYRAATEASMAASLLVFIYIFLRLTAAHGLARMLLGVWMIAQLGLIALAVIDARLAATFARASFAAIAGFGMIATSYLALRGQDRALSLLPTWILFLVWVFAASMTLTGRLAGDVVVSSLVAGLVLITVLVGFTVTQFAFRSFEPSYGTAPNEQQLRSLAIDGSGAAVWEWNARREEIKTGQMMEASLGLPPGELSRKVEDFCGHLHPADRERFRLLLWSVQERGGGEIRTDFRMRHADNSYRWFDLEAASTAETDRRALRCVGLVREITDIKRSQERMVQDAVHDSLTGLPNRELFVDRLGVAVTRAQTMPGVAPTVMIIDIDKFKSVNASLGLIVGDSLLLTLARRLQRHLEPQDTLARIGGSQFALLLLQSREQRDLAQHAERIRRSLRSPIKLDGKDVVLTGAIGIAIHDDQIHTAEELFKDAEIAMYRAKRGGDDRIEIYRAEFRNEADERQIVEADLAAAIEKKQLLVLYQPIISLATEELAGFETIVRWHHPKLGVLSLSDIVPVADKSELIHKLGTFMLTRALDDASQWQRMLPRAERPLFVSINVSSRKLLRQELVAEVRQGIGRAMMPVGALRIEISEAVVMENPERSIEVLEGLRAAGAGLSLDDFGTGYSSLTYLQRFAFDTIKIDRDLVQSSSSDGSGSVIVRSIVALAHELAKKVVAEGIEVESEVGFLRSIGCEYAQGFYYGEPMVDREVAKMLKVIGKTEHRLQRTGFFRTTLKPTRRVKAARAKPQGDLMQAAGTTAPAMLQSAEGVEALDRRKPGMRTRARPSAVAKGRAVGQAAPQVSPRANPLAGQIPTPLLQPSMAVAGHVAQPSMMQAAAEPPPAYDGRSRSPVDSLPQRFPLGGGVQHAGDNAPMMGQSHLPQDLDRLAEAQAGAYSNGYAADSQSGNGQLLNGQGSLRPIFAPAPQMGDQASADAAKAAALLQDIASLVARDPNGRGHQPAAPQSEGLPSGMRIPRLSQLQARQARPGPNLSTLPPAIAASLAKLAKSPSASGPATPADRYEPARPVTAREDT